MNKIVLIGNGFDLAHGLKTRYEDFINWYWDYRVNGFTGNVRTISKDSLCSFEIKNPYNCWNTFYFNLPQTFNKKPGNDIIKLIINDTEQFNVAFSPFFNRIINSIETKGWVDIENEYYQLLAEYALNNNSDINLINLNKQLQYLQERLIDYLRLVNQHDIVVNNKIYDKIYAPINSSDVSIEARKVVEDYVEWWKKQDQITWKRKLYSYGISGINSDIYIDNTERYIKDPDFFPDYSPLFMLPDNILLLSFNYTKTAQEYLIKNKQNFLLNYIHGRIEKPQSIIFGYGDELDENYYKLQKLNNNECLSNVKTIKYQESDNYRKVLEFVESAPFQVCIMGHSCGNSDRTLLNTLFEHKNCISIKPYYYIKDDGTDNYIELIQNISRNFTDMKLMRDRVVNKTYCEPLAE